MLKAICGSCYKAPRFCGTTMGNLSEAAKRQSSGSRPSANDETAHFCCHLLLWAFSHSVPEDLKFSHLRLTEHPRKGPLRRELTIAPPVSVGPRNSLLTALRNQTLWSFRWLKPLMGRYGLGRGTKGSSISGKEEFLLQGAKSPIAKSRA